MKKDNHSSVANFESHGRFRIIYMLLTFRLYVGMVNDGSNSIAGDIAARVLGSVKQAGVISAYNSVVGIPGMFLFIVNGILNRKISPRYMSSINYIIAGMAYVGVPNAPNTFVHTLMTTLTYGTIVSAGYLSNGVVMVNWFSGKKRAVMGYTTTGHNLAATLFVSLILYLAVVLDVERACYPISEDCIILGLIGPLFARDTFFERGLLSDNVPEAVYEKHYDTDRGGQDRDGGWTTAGLLKTDQAWLCAVTTGIFQIYSIGTMSQMISRATNGSRFVVTVAAAIMSVCTVVGVVGSFFIGVLDQKIGTRRAIILLDCWYALALLAGFTNTMADSWVPIVVIGIGIGGSANLTTSLPTSVFGHRGFDKVNSVLLPIQGIVTALTFTINGTVIAMAGGNARYAYLIDACLALVNVVLVLFLTRDHEYNDDWIVERTTKQSG